MVNIEEVSNWMIDNCRGCLSELGLIGVVSLDVPNSNLVLEVYSNNVSKHVTAAFTTKEVKTGAYKANFGQVVRQLIKATLETANTN